MFSKNIFIIILLFLLSIFTLGCFRGLNEPDLFEKDLILGTWMYYQVCYEENDSCVSLYNQLGHGYEYKGVTRLQFREDNYVYVYQGNFILGFNYSIEKKEIPDFYLEPVITISGFGHTIESLDQNTLVIAPIGEIGHREIYYLRKIKDN